MNKSAFLQQLERLLADLAPEERSAALEYYTEYLDEAGEAGEADVLRELGSPEEVAAAIRSARPAQQDWAAGYVGNDGTASYGTCYEDEAPPVSPAAPAQDAADASAGAAAAAGSADAAGPRGFGGAGGAPGQGGQPGQPGPTGLGSLLWVVLMVCAFPLWCALFGLLMGLIGALLGLVGGGVVVLVVGVLACVASAPLLTTAFASGLLNMGLALLTAALGLVLLAGASWGFSGVIPAAVRGVKRLMQVLKRKVRTL